VREFVGDDRFQFVAVERAEQTRRDDEFRVVGRESGRYRQRAFALRDMDRRCREVGGLCDPRDRRTEVGVRRGADGRGVEGLRGVLS
jgi:hypothetical protein